MKKGDKVRLNPGYRMDYRQRRLTEALDWDRFYTVDHVIRGIYFDGVFLVEHPDVEYDDVLFEKAP